MTDMADLYVMKTVAKIDPEKEYENAKKIIDLAMERQLDPDHASSLDHSVENLITATRVLIEREERRRGKKKNIPREYKSKGRQKGEKRNDSKKLPSERYPDLDIEESKVTPDELPLCPCCNEQMTESGLYDTSEKIEVDPKRYRIKRNLRPKYNCSKCHGSMINTKAPASIIPTSNYGDSLIIDVALSKYCDLIPIERYAQMAMRNGPDNLPAQSLIGGTHHLANFLLVVYEKIKIEILISSIIYADETPHKMLEGDDKKNWYLWGFFCQQACYFEIHNTRSGDVPLNILSQSRAEYLVSDGYQGYGRAIKEIKEKYSRTIIEVDCNAHAFRYFKDAMLRWKKEAEPILTTYGKIYKLESKKKCRGLSREEQFAIRQQMIPLFESIKSKCEEIKIEAIRDSSIDKAIKYFLNHYDGLTVCTYNIDVDLDNNRSEREVRSPVVGRKTWLGTHSKRGAYTAAVLFSIVHSCKINNINPRKYFPWVVERIHQGKEVLTPHQYSMEIQ